MRLSDEQIAEKKQLAADHRLHAKHADGLARADQERHDLLGERMWKLEAAQHRRQAKQHEQDIKDERLSRRIDRIRARISACQGVVS